MTLDALGATRFGTFIQKSTGDAVTDLKYKHNATQANTVGSMGAFSYSTMQETQRSRHVATTTGNAEYSGMTQAISGTGVTYTGLIDIQIRFSSNSVSGLIRNLMDADGAPWQFRYGDVDTIVLPKADLAPNAKWTSGNIVSATSEEGTPNTADDAQATYVARAGSPGPQTIEDSRWQGILLGRNAAAGSEANGIWEIGAHDKGKAGYLVGGFGVTRGDDSPSPRPDSDDGSSAATMVMSGWDHDENSSTADRAHAQATIADGKMTLKLNQYAKGGEGSTFEVQQDASGTNKTMNLEIDLAQLVAAGSKTYSGSKYVASAVADIQKARDKIATLVALDDSNLNTNIDTAWESARTALTKVFKTTPSKFVASSDSTNYDRDDNLGLLDRALAALASASALEAAMDGDGSGIFNDMDAATAANTTKAIKTIAGERTAAQMMAQSSYQVLAKVSSTEYTRFGVWRLRNYADAARSTAGANNNGATEHNRDRDQESAHGDDGPGMFAYSPLDPTVIADVADPSYTPGGSATFMGEAVALQGTATLTGEARADIVWNENSVGGTLAVTISDLQNGNGDRLAIGTASSATGLGRDLVFSNISVSTDANNNLVFDSAEIAGTRLNYVNRSTPAFDDFDSSMIGGKFIGQSVDGPLGVIGTWEIEDSTLGRYKGAGGGVTALGVRIYGAFGAEAP